MQNSRHYKLHLQCRDGHILAGRPLLSFLPLHNPVIWSSLSYNLSIAFIRSLLYHTLSGCHTHSPGMLVGCNAMSQFQHESV